MNKVDHLIYAVPDLEEGILLLENLMGVKAIFGGKHIGIGTHNALIGLGENCYLEIIAPDPQQTISEPLWFGIDRLQKPKLITWAARVNNVEQHVKNAHANGIAIGAAMNAGRKKADGSLLSWKFSDPRVILDSGLIPFLIDWGESEHPSKSLKHPCRLVSLTATHPQANEVQKKLGLLKLNINFTNDSTIKLSAQIETPKGIVTLL